MVSRSALETRLPRVIRARDTRPSIGERTWVNSRFRRAASSCARIERNVGFGFGLRGRELFEFLARDRVLREQTLRACAGRLGELELGLTALEFGAQAVDLELERARIDLEQQLIALDARAFDELDAIDVAADARRALPPTLTACSVPVSSSQ